VLERDELDAEGFSGVDVLRIGTAGGGIDRDDVDADKGGVMLDLTLRKSSGCRMARRFLCFS
jgi:hypothetical protein